MTTSSPLKRKRGDEENADRRPKSAAYSTRSYTKQAPFRFMDLPGELRNTVYTIHRDRHPGSLQFRAQTVRDVTKNKKRKRTTANELLKITQVNKQMRSETLALYTRNIPLRIELPVSTPQRMVPFKLIPDIAKFPRCFGQFITQIIVVISGDVPYTKFSHLAKLAEVFTVPAGLYRDIVAADGEANGIYRASPAQGGLPPFDSSSKARETHSDFPLSKDTDTPEIPAEQRSDPKGLHFTWQYHEDCYFPRKQTAEFPDSFISFLSWVARQGKCMREDGVVGEQEVRKRLFKQIMEGRVLGKAEEAFAYMRGELIAECGGEANVKDLGEEAVVYLARREKKGD